MEQFFSFTLVGGLFPVVAFFPPFVDGSFELCNNWLCTSSDVETGLIIQYLKKSESSNLQCLVMLAKTSSEIDPWARSSQCYPWSSYSSPELGFQPGSKRNKKAISIKVRLIIVLFFQV
jgi:hypothetical protein